MTDRMPPPTDAEGADFIECPWCGADCSDATLTLAQLVRAHDGGALRLAAIEADGRAAAFALTCDCANCGKPMVVTLRAFGRAPAQWRWLGLHGVRGRAA